MLYDAHTKAFTALGDITKRGISATAPDLETVLLAVKQVLDSGVTSIEHVLNVLPRLNELPIPEQVETSLKLNEEPLADTARYDSLNNQEVSHVWHH